jgi:beta-mannosidase
MRITELNSWEFRRDAPKPLPGQSTFTDQWRPAQVPGHVHLDLVQNQVIADPFVQQFEAGAQWVDREDWRYRTSFTWDPTAELPVRKLLFEGLDTIATVYLNGEKLAFHDNMHLPLEVDVTEKLKSGQNEIEVHFASAVNTGETRRLEYMHKEGLDPETTGWFDERAFVRKAGYMSGWDWGPRLVSAGIWKPAGILEYAARIADFQVFTQRVDEMRWRVWSETQIEGEASLTVTFDGTEMEGELDMIIDNPTLWWPNGEGESFLYPVVAELSTGQTEMEWIGFRDIQLVQEPDEYGESFEFVVNGRRVYIRGANWIPNDSFPSRITEDDYDEQMEVAASLGFNMIRVWGGGLYADDTLMDACDRHGILVWQDFGYGCSYYPDDEAYSAASRLEAEGNVRRMRHHASMALWCGNNENETMWEGKWGGELSPPRYYGESIYAEVLADVVARLDPKTPYIRTSPIGGKNDPPNVGSNAGGRGDQHNWDVWHGSGDWRVYANSTARFSSEFGFASACSMVNWRDVVDRLDIAPTEQVIQWHNKTGKSAEVFAGYVEMHYPASRSLDDWVYYSQLNQRDALRFGIEHYRMADFCRGVLIWQMNDCWPVSSWAIQDYRRQIKPAGFELARLYAAVVLHAVVEDGKVRVGIANETGSPIEGSLYVQFYGMDGALLNAESHPFRADGHGSHEVADISTEGFDTSETVVRVSAPGLEVAETWRTLAHPKEMRWQEPKLTRTGTGLRVEGLAYDLVVRDAEEDFPIALRTWYLRGSEAICVANDEVRFPPGVPGRLVYRCMGSQGAV